ncbi:flagellar biosynthesis protein FlhB [bacterium]|nr:flagellar biosynthesis protein FlhB [bacterium]
MKKQNTEYRIQNIEYRIPVLPEAIDFDLTLFGKAEDEGRTEDPTGRKISKARGEGQVAKSQEIQQVISLLIGIWFLSVFGARMFYELYKYVHSSLSSLHQIELSIGNVVLLGSNAFLFILKLCLPLMIIISMAIIAANLAQFGFMFNWNSIKPKWSNVKLFNPKAVIDFMKKMWISPMTLFNLAKSAFKAGVIGVMAYQVIEKNYLVLLLLLKTEVVSAFFFVSKLAFDITIRSIVFLAISAFADYLYQRHEWKQNMQMKKEEVKDERKMMEGDPQIKSKQREKMMEALAKRMMAEVPKADVIITNPTHIAIALKYDTAAMNAPTVVAKGLDDIALKIIETAKENGVPTVENKPLAAGLYELCEIGDEVPEELYQAVAEVLSYVYKMKNKQAA